MTIQQTDPDPSASVSVFKAALIWAATGFSAILTKMGIHSWGDFAAGMAGIYSVLLIIDWVWKKMMARKIDSSKG